MGKRGGMGVGSRGVCEYGREDGAGSAGQAGGHPGLDDRISALNVASVGRYLWPVQRMGNSFNHPARRGRRELCIGIERYYVLNPYQRLRVPDLQQSVKLGISLTKQIAV